MQHQTQDPLSPSRFTFGCMSLGSDLARLDDHIRIARQAMEAGIWFHASPTYHRGFTYMVLRMAFDEARSQVPPMMIKIRCGSARLLSFEVDDVLRRLGIERVELAQLVFTETGPDPLVRDFSTRQSGGVSGGCSGGRSGGRSGGEDESIADVCGRLKREGKVARFAPQCSADTSAALLPLFEADCFDGAVLYLNPLQRDVDQPLWDFFQAKHTRLWALRTLAGAAGDPERLELQQQKNPGDSRLGLARRMLPLVGESGCQDWTDFCVRYAASIPNLQTTIGGTANPDHLARFLETAHKAQPLPDDIVGFIERMRDKPEDN